MLDDYYYGRSDTIDVDLWRHNERKYGYYFLCMAGLLS